jgi:serine-protein kinase
MSDILSLTLPAKADYIGALRMFISAVAARMNFSIVDIDDIRTAVSEGCTLIMRSCPKTVEISVESGEELSVMIKANGELICGDKDANEFSLMLIDAMASKVEFENADEKYSSIKMNFKVRD